MTSFVSNASVTEVSLLQKHEPRYVCSSQTCLPATNTTAVNGEEKRILTWERQACVNRLEEVKRRAFKVKAEGFC